ncbi:GIY-YIG nuclease family protein [Paeniclostridium hominis]|uniref:GIY-YIG nuclease family protein n=1 Tax=Paeniclostridium hominis TaxID=2764329 RepID=UPI0022E39CBE|nr:GIY-YIG nuclease family protein [Paeniclostridium hominis]
MVDMLQSILDESGIKSIFEFKKLDDMSSNSNPYVCYKVKSNIYRIRSFELYKSNNILRFRVKLSKYVDNVLKTNLNELSEVVSKAQRYVDFEADTLDNFIDIGKNIKSLLDNNDIIESCKSSAPRATTSQFEGLDLPDIDTSQDDVIGQTFTWRDIISIWEDDSEDNKLKQALSQNGIYIQRSKDGKSRYVGSAYGEGGIIARWMKHLNSNGDAQHLNLFILENGYNEIVFAVLEFYDGEDIIQKENMWKNTLGTLNAGAYNGIQLNKN